MLGIRDTVKRIFSTENALQKHIVMFMLAGFTAMLSMPLNEISRKVNLTSGEWLTSMGLFILSLAVSLFVLGYILRTVHNSYDRETFDIMPEFSMENYKIIFKAMPMLLAWFGYFMIFSFILAFGFFLSVAFKTFVPTILLFLVILFTIIILPMVFVDFARNYETKGLLGIHKPFTYLKKCGKGMLLTILKLLPIFIVMHFINIICMNSNNVFAYIIIAIVGYIGMIYNLVLYLSYGQVLKDKFYNE